MGAANGAALPSGRVALLFSDIEGSTALLTRLGATYGDVLDVHDRIMREAFTRHEGREFSNEGDAFGAAFADPVEAVRAVAEIQQQIAAHPWPAGELVRVRMGIHYGEPKLRGNNYWGEDVHFAARVCSAAHGGQVVMSAAMRATVGPGEAISLGHHGLKDFPTPRELFQLVLPGVPVERFPAPKTLSTFRSNLPSITTPLIGRDDVLADLDELVATGHRLVTLTGAGGMGKTRVAIAMGERLAGEFRDGVAFVPFAEVDDAGVIGAIAEATGAPRGGAVEVAVLEHLARRRALLILDNCEHVLAATADVVRTILEQCPGVVILATAQLPFDLGAETVYRLPPLANGADMFLDRARARDRSFSLSAVDRRRVEELCALLEGFPLGIELAAARVRLLGVDRLLAALSHDLSVLGAGSRDLAERHRSIGAALGWTLSLLSDEEREIFTTLGCFASAWTLDQAEQLLVEDVGALELWEAVTRLMDASLVTVRGDGRFSMPQRVRQHASELLDAAPDASRVRQRHAEVVGRELRELALQCFVDFRRQFANMVDLLPEARRAVAWTRDHDPAGLRHVAGLMVLALHHTGHLALVADDLLRFPEPAVAQSYDDANLLLGIDLIHVMQSSHDHDRLHDLTDRARQGFERYGDPREVVIARHLSIGPLFEAGRVEEAVKALADYQAAAAEVSDPRWRLEVARLVGIGQAETSAEITSVARTHGVGEGAFSMTFPLWLAWALGNEGDLPRAAALFERSLRDRPRDQLYPVLDSVKGIASVLALSGRDELALELRAAVNTIYRLRTGAEHRDFEESWGDVFEASEARLEAGQLAAAQARGAALSYDELTDRALAAAQLVSAQVDEPA